MGALKRNETLGTVSDFNSEQTDPNSRSIPSSQIDARRNRRKSDADGGSGLSRENPSPFDPELTPK